MERARGVVRQEVDVQERLHRAAVAVGVDGGGGRRTVGMALRGIVARVHDGHGWDQSEYHLDKRSEQQGEKGKAYSQSQVNGLRGLWAESDPAPLPHRRCRGADGRGPSHTARETDPTSAVEQPGLPQRTTRPVTFGVHGQTDP